jgi:hypothetical protein
MERDILGRIILKLILRSNLWRREADMVQIWIYCDMFHNHKLLLPDCVNEATGLGLPEEESTCTYTIINWLYV